MADSPELQALLDAMMHPELKAIDLSLGRVERHLQAIGYPELNLPPVVHVAGTNGKGSTIAFLRAMLEAAGYSCHQFTSPHLVHFRERIVVAGEEISDAQLIPLLQSIIRDCADYPLTFFEANTVAAFRAFAKTPADITLLEVGLGGRLDATNVIKQPALCIITPISFDHQEFLGDNLAAIAAEKAGIIKPGVPVVVAPQAPEAMAVIRQKASECNAPLIEVVPENMPALGLDGAHQHINAATARAAARQLAPLGYARIDVKAIQQGLTQARWPARLQRLNAGEWVEQLPENCQLILDGGHNEAASHMLHDWIKAQKLPVHVIIAMAAHKDAAAFLRGLGDAPASLCLSQCAGESWAMPLEVLVNAAETIGIRHQQAESLDAAFSDFIQSVAPPAILLICGSLYMAGKVLEKNR